jgi:hypothetical protein
MKELHLQPQGRGFINRLIQDHIMKKPTNKPRSQPAHKIRHGAISASIWRQETEKGPIFNVTFQRAYRDGEEWKNSESFGRKDLLVVSLIAARSFEWIATQSGKKKAAPDASQPGDDVPF